MWDKIKMANAINAVRNEEMGFKKNIEVVRSEEIDTQK
jgi:hypothetical protein